MKPCPVTYAEAAIESLKGVGFALLLLGAERLLSWMH